MPMIVVNPYQDTPVISVNGVGTPSLGAGDGWVPDPCSIKAGDKVLLAGESVERTVVARTGWVLDVTPRESNPETKLKQ